MLMLPSGIKVYVSSQPVDMKKSFNGLSNIVKKDFKKEPLSGDIFVFFNRKANKVKLLYWDRFGFAIWYKSLNEGKFRLPRINQKVYTMSINELNFLLEGIDLLTKSRLKTI